jgi:ABC-type dipeptide transport system, periplasmic component
MRGDLSLKWLTLAVCVTALAGCKPSSGTVSGGHNLPPNPLVSTAEPGKRGGQFVLATATGPKTFNPLRAFDGASDAIVRLLVGSLINLDLVTYQAGPGLAESWSVAPDQKTWTFKLRQGLRWSDGQPLNADDVEFTWNQIMYNPQYNGLTYDLFRIKGKNFEVTRVDDVTIRVVTPEVFAPFLEFFGGVPILPKHILAGAVENRVFQAAYGVNMKPEKIVGCGPYRVKEFQPGRFTLLERNPEYWMVDKKGQRLPYFDEVKFVVAGAGSEAMLFINGKSDAFEIIRPENYEAFKQQAAIQKFEIINLGVGTERDFIWFNQNTGTNKLGRAIVDPKKLKWFRDKKFRQAISCGIDRDRVAREIYGGRAAAMFGFISSENQKWNNPAIPRYEFNPEKARNLLKEIGMIDRDGDGVLEDSDGNPVEIIFNSNTGNPARERSAALIIEGLKKLGVVLQFQPVDFKVLIEKINSTFDYECALMGLGGGGVDPSSQMNVLRSTDELHQWFPFQQTPSTPWEARIDELMDLQMQTLDFGQRKKQFDEVQQILAEELPMIYTVSPYCYAAIRRGVGNLRPSVLTPYRVTWNLEELYFKK